MGLGEGFKVGVSEEADFVAGLLEGFSQGDVGLYVTAGT